MCCFSQPVASVTDTNIFARAGDGARQFLVYSMSIDADRELAMILPLPVRTPAGENDLEFIDLKDYPDFFADLARGFPPPPQSNGDTAGAIPASASRAALPVITVGDFEASFVPTTRDFSRLDERFRISDDAWKKLPAYDTYGFAVFKLKAGAMTVHPMAFSFPRRDTRALFFPTVHIHDGHVHEQADFDHVLYAQSREGEPLSTLQWDESSGPPSQFMKIAKTKGILLPDQHCHKHALHGLLANRDTLLPLAT